MKLPLQKSSYSPATAPEKAWLMTWITRSLGDPKRKVWSSVAAVSLRMKPRFNRPVGARNHFWRLLVAPFTRSPTWNLHTTQSNYFAPTKQWGCQSHQLAENKGLNVWCGKWCLLAENKKKEQFRRWLLTHCRKAIKRRAYRIYILGPAVCENINFPYMPTGECRSHWSEWLSTNLPLLRMIVSLLVLSG